MKNFIERLIPGSYELMLTRVVEACHILNCQSTYKPGILGETWELVGDQLQLALKGGGVAARNRLSLKTPTILHHHLRFDHIHTETREDGGKVVFSGKNGKLILDNQQGEIQIRIE